METRSPDEIIESITKTALVYIIKNEKGEPQLAATAKQGEAKDLRVMVFSSVKKAEEARKKTNSNKITATIPEELYKQLYQIKQLDGIIVDIEPGKDLTGFPIDREELQTLAKISKIPVIQQQKIEICKN